MDHLGVFISDFTLKVYESYSGKMLDLNGVFKRLSLIDLINCH